VRPDEWRRSLQVNVVGDEDDLAWREVRVDAAGCVRHHERADPESTDDADPERDPIGGNALVEVGSADHRRARNVAEGPDHEHARMPDGGRDGPAGDLPIGDLDTILEFLHEATETAAEDESDPRLDRRPLTDGRDRVLDRHAEPSATRLS